MMKRICLIAIASTVLLALLAFLTLGRDTQAESSVNHAEGKDSRTGGEDYPVGWPDLLFTGEGEPSYNWELQGRDFGYRTGNHVGASLFFKVPQGCELFTDQLSVDGDFQLVDKQEHRQSRGGQTFVRLDLTLQTFVYKTPAWQVKVRIAYRPKDGALKQLELLPIEVSSSNTFDGKKDKHPKELPVDYMSNAAHLSVTAVFLLAGTAGLIYSLMLFRGKRGPVSNKAPEVQPPADKPDQSLPERWQQLTGDWRAITGGEATRVHFAAAAEAMRSIYAIEPLTTGEIRDSSIAQKEDIACFLGVCEKALWSDDNTSAEEIAAASAALERLIKTVQNPD